MHMLVQHRQAPASQPGLCCAKIVVRNANTHDAHDADEGQGGGAGHQAMRHACARSITQGGNDLQTLGAREHTDAQRETHREIVARHALGLLFEVSKVHVGDSRPVVELSPKELRKLPTNTAHGRQTTHRQGRRHAQRSAPVPAAALSLQ